MPTPGMSGGAVAVEFDGSVVAEAVADIAVDNDGDADDGPDFADELLSATQDAPAPPAGSSVPRPANAVPANVQDLYQLWQATKAQRENSDRRFGPGPLAATCLRVEVNAFRRFSEAVCSYPGVVQISPCMGYRKAPGGGSSPSIVEVPIGAAHMIPVPSMTNGKGGGL